MEAWETGKIDGKDFVSDRRYQRSFQFPALIDSLQVDPAKIPDLLVTDAAGIRRCYRWMPETEKDENS